MKKSILSLLVFLFAILMTTCKKDNDKTDVVYKVYVTKVVDSLPCSVNVEYSDYKTTYNEQITSNWNLVKNLPDDGVVTLMATAVTNIAGVKVELTVKDNSIDDHCDGNNCSVSVRKNMHD